MWGSTEKHDNGTSLLQNHCDWPEKSHCNRKANLRLTGGDEEVEVSDDKPLLACYFTNWAYYRCVPCGISRQNTYYMKENLQERNKIK